MTTKTQEKPKQDLAVPFKSYLTQDNIKQRFNEILGPRRGAQFISSLITVWNGNTTLQRCTHESILGAAAQAAALDLSIVPTIGHAAIVPYKTRKGGDEVYLAQFQIMTRGIVQMAHRSGEYRRMNLAEVYEGQLISHDEFAGIVKLDAAKRVSDKVIGLYFTFELVNGFEHKAYWSISRCLGHGLRYSKSFGYGSGLWTEDPNIPKTKDGDVDFKALKALISNGKAVVNFGSGCCSMCAKTVVKNTLTKWGPLSSDMMDAFTADQTAITTEGQKTYIDATSESEAAALDGPMPQRASEKKAEDQKAPEQIKDERPTAWTATGKVLRVAKTEVGGSPVDVVVIDVDGKEEKVYTSIKDMAEAARAFVDKAISVKADNVGGKHWLVEFKAA